MVAEEGLVVAKEVFTEMVFFFFIRIKVCRLESIK